jgi:hypothetical protein
LVLGISGKLADPGLKYSIHSPSKPVVQPQTQKKKKAVVIGLSSIANLIFSEKQEVGTEDFRFQAMDELVCSVGYSREDRKKVGELRGNIGVITRPPEANSHGQKNPKMR